MEMVRLFLLSASIAAVASAAGFSLAVGPPVAAGTGNKLVKKTAASFAVRLEECEDPSKAQVTATAEGLVNGARSSAATTLYPAGTPGVYLISQDWPPEGVWVVNLSATCGGAKAGAIVPVRNAGFARESLQLFSRPATRAEIDAALKAAELKAAELKALDKP